MASMVNIPSHNDDPAYRYKMPKLVVKIEGRGNGIKTNIVNMVDVARALKRPPSYPTKFFGCELGAQSKFDESTDKAIVNGEHQQADMQALLDKFIERYVLCQNCHLPEIDMSVKKGDIKGVCKACGWRGSLDTTHKVATFILKNPPQGTEGFGGIAKTRKKDKAERQREKAERQRKEAAGEDDEEEEVVVKEKKEKKEKKHKKDKEDRGEDDGERKEKKEKKDKSEKKHHKHHKHDDEASEEGSTKKSSKKKHSKKSSGDEASQKDGGAAGDAGDSSTQEMELAPLTSQSPELQEAVLDPLAAAVKDAGGLPTMPVDDFLQELRLLQISQRFSHVTRLYVALEVIFSAEEKGLCKDTFEARLPYVGRVIENAGLTTAEVCEAFEVMYAMHPDKTKIAHYPYVLKDLYDENLVTESALLKHYETNNNRRGFSLCRKAAAPFLEWLKTAEAEDSSSEDDDDDDSDDDEEEEEESPKKKNSVAQKKAPKVQDDLEDDGSDVDVDAI